MWLQYRYDFEFYLLKAYKYVLSAEISLVNSKEIYKEIIKFKFIL